MDVSEQLADLTKRLEYQELLHNKIDPKTNSFVHWDTTATLTVLVSIFMAGVITVLIINHNK